MSSRKEPVQSCLQPGSSVGILGGGQLGAMLASAASEMGLIPAIYAPESDSPAFQRSARSVCAAYDDTLALTAFATSVDVITYEFENVPLEAAELVSGVVPIRPGVRALQVAQDRLTEKEFLRDCGIPIAPFAAVGGLSELADAISAIGLPAVLKTRRFGYDGKGQIILRDGDNPVAAFDALNRVPCVLEAFVPFFAETSSIAARGLEGETAIYEMGLNSHKNHILDRTEVPSGLPLSCLNEAAQYARKIVDRLSYVGVIGVEFFVAGTTDKPKLMVNEIAPRVHNSGHWTQDGCLVSQFEQHIRAISGWRLGATDHHSETTMVNLVGDDVLHWANHASVPGSRVHLYGKTEVRTGRKMGHVNMIRPLRKA